jgi:hypothetical protein
MLTRLLTVFVCALLPLVISCRHGSTRDRISENHLPRVILWAWERPEDLEFLNPEKFGIAFLAQTLTIKGSEVVFNPRHQPLKVPPGAKLIAVTRIESQKITHQPVELTDEVRTKLVERILKTLELNNVSAIQVDFDVVPTERAFYSRLLQDLRHQLPDNVPLSMTALASFCVGDRWVSDLPVDEAVPMVFRMGTDSDPIKRLLTSGGDFKVDEAAYRLGFEAALHPDRRGKSYESCVNGLQKRYAKDCESKGFRGGYERGQAYQRSLEQQKEKHDRQSKKAA